MYQGVHFTVDNHLVTIDMALYIEDRFFMSGGTKERAAVPEVPLPALPLRTVDGYFPLATAADSLDLLTAYYQDLLQRIAQSQQAPERFQHFFRLYFCFYTADASYSDSMEFESNREILVFVQYLQLAPAGSRDMFMLAPGWNVWVWADADTITLAHEFAHDASIWPESFDKQAFQEHMGVILHDTNVFITRMEERLGGPYFSF